MSKIIMTQPLCAAGYEPLAKEGEIYVANNGNPATIWISWRTRNALWYASAI